MEEKPHISPCFVPGMKLGNLMFAIAAAYAYSCREQIRCRVPWSFNQESRELYHALGDGALPRTLCGANEAVAYEEPGFAYTPIPEGFICGGLRGYFQNIHYFADCEHHIRHLFRPLLAPAKTLGTVGIHIPIGKERGRLNKHRLYTAFFLHKAFAHLSSDVREVTIFSDNPGEAAAMLAELPEYCDRFVFRVDHSSRLEMLRQMSSMQMLVISSDSLSWWAAWLATPRKVVVPKYWFRQNEKMPPLPAASEWIVL